MPQARSSGCNPPRWTQATGRATATQSRRRGPLSSSSPPELREKPARHPFWVSADRALFQLDAVRLRVTTKMPWRRRDPFTITSGRPTGRCLLRELRVGVVGPFPKGGQPIPGHVVGGGEASRCTRWSTVGAPLEHRWSVRTHCGDGQSVPGETARSSIGRSRR